MAFLLEHRLDLVPLLPKPMKWLLCCGLKAHIPKLAFALSPDLMILRAQARLYSLPHLFTIFISISSVCLVIFPNLTINLPTHLLFLVFLLLGRDAMTKATQPYGSH